MRFRVTSPRKYKNVPVEVDGLRFDSKRESIRFFTLRLMERAGDIKDLKRQVRFPLNVEGKKIGAYVADFTYLDTTTKEEIVEDTKGFVTDLFKWKAKHFEAQYGKPIKVTA